MVCLTHPCLPWPAASLQGFRHSLPGSMQWLCRDMQLGIEPGAFHMQNQFSATDLVPHQKTRWILHPLPFSLIWGSLSALPPPPPQSAYQRKHSGNSISLPKHSVGGECVTSDLPRGQNNPHTTIWSRISHAGKTPLLASSTRTAVQANQWLPWSPPPPISPLHSAGGHSAKQPQPCSASNQRLI